MPWNKKSVYQTGIHHQPYAYEDFVSTGKYESRLNFWYNKSWQILATPEYGTVYYLLIIY